VSLKVLAGLRSNRGQHNTIQAMPIQVHTVWMCCAVLVLCWCDAVLVGAVLVLCFWSRRIGLYYSVLKVYPMLPLPCLLPYLSLLRSHSFNLEFPSAAVLLRPHRPHPSTALPANHAPEPIGDSRKRVQSVRMKVIKCNCLYTGPSLSSGLRFIHEPVTKCKDNTQ
jgi:hypothetical protein